LRELHDLHARRRAKRPRTSSSERFRIWISEPPIDLRHLLVREPQVSVIVFFHEFHDVRKLGLPFRRPSQHSIENFFNLISCHGSGTAYLPQLRTGAAAVGWPLPSGNPRMKSARLRWNKPYPFSAPSGGAAE